MIPVHFLYSSFFLTYSTKNEVKSTRTKSEKTNSSYGTTQISSIGKRKDKLNLKVTEERFDLTAIKNDTVSMQSKLNKIESMVNKLIIANDKISSRNATMDYDFKLLTYNVKYLNEFISEVDRKMSDMNKGISSVQQEMAKLILKNEQAVVRKSQTEVKFHTPVVQVTEDIPNLKQRIRKETELELGAKHAREVTKISLDISKKATQETTEKINAKYETFGNKLHEFSDHFTNFEHFERIKTVEDAIERESEKYTISKQKEMQQIGRDLIGYAREVAAFTGHKNSPQFLHIQEMLHRFISKLDNMQNLRNNEKLKSDRKALIQKIHSIDKQLEAKVN